MGETSVAMDVGIDIETYVKSNTFLGDNEVSTDHTETSQTMDVETEIETSLNVNEFLADNKVLIENEEILNRLPLHVQCYIFAHLPMKDGVKTSVLSKTFKSIWHSLPRLIFNFQEFPNIEGKEGIFEEFVNRTLLQHDSSCVILFELSIRHRAGPHPRISVEWIKFGLDHLVQHLILHGVIKDNQRLPNSLFTSKSLITLDLSMVDYVLTWPTNVFLPNLAELKLWGLIFLEENVIFHFSKTSPFLQELIIWYCNFSNVKLVYISAPVEHLVLKHCEINTCKVELRTSGLTYFEYNNPLASGFDFEGLSPNFDVIVYVYENDRVERREDNIVRCAVELYTELRNASFMLIDEQFIQYLTQGEAILLNMKPILFNYLTTLKVSISASVQQYKMLIFILSRCPNLTYLKIKIVSKYKIPALDGVKLNWKEMLHYKILASLEFLKVKNLCGSIGQMGLVEFLLLKACEVEEINILPLKTIDNLGNSIMGISEESWNTITARILEFKRASSAHISFE